MVLVKVSQGNSSEVSEICSHMLFSSLTETLQVKFQENQVFDSISPAPTGVFLGLFGGLIGFCCWLAGRLTVVNVVTY